LFDSELDQYLAVTPEQIKNVTAKYLNIDNRVVLDIVPPVSEAASSAATDQPPGEPSQPAAPAPQIPSAPAPKPPPADAVVTGKQLDQSQQPADPPQPKEMGSGPLHT